MASINAEQIPLTLPENGRRVDVDSALVPDSSFADLNTVIRDTCNRFLRTTGWALTFQRAEDKLADDLEERLSQDADCYWHARVESGFSTIGLMSIVRGREQLPEDRTKISDSPFLQSRLRRLVFPLPDACDAADIVVNLLSKIATRSQVLELADTPAEHTKSRGRRRTLDPNAQRRLDVLRFLAGFDAVALFLSEEDSLRLQATSGLSFDQVPLPERSPDECIAESMSISGLEITIQQPHGLLPSNFACGLCVPLDRRDRKLGVLWFYATAKPESLRTQSVEQAISLAGKFAGALEDMVLSRLTADHTELQREMRLLGQIQKTAESIPPPKDPRIEYSYFTQGTTEVNGDLCENISLDEHRTFFAIGDACGHGLPAAVITSTVRGCLRCMVTDNSPIGDLSDLLRTVGNAINTTTPTYMFMTLFIGVVDTQHRKLIYSNAGHPSPLMFLPNGQVTRLEGTGLLLGVMEDADYRDFEVDFEPETKLVAFSDGITEARNEHKELFLHDGVLNAVTAVDRPGKNTDELLASVLTTVRDHSGDDFPDDISLLILRHNQCEPSGLKD
ncbi:MAG: PP2C family protein-serine/threonine phosphatase [Planctomycetaceae bacterium]